jgi:hypothetical protein
MSQNMSILFQANLHQLVVRNIIVFNDETIICFTSSMPPNYRKVMSFNETTSSNSSIFDHKFDPKRNIDERHEPTQ